MCTLRTRARTCVLISLALSVAACGVSTDSSSFETTGAAVAQGSAEAAAILALLNDPATDVVVLDDLAALDRRAAANLMAHRNGPDGIVGTDDDNLFDDLDEVDAIKFVGNKALQQLLAFATTHGYLVASVGPVADADALMLDLVNADDLTVELLDVEVGLDSRAARNIVAFRAGMDGVFGTLDDRRFETVADLDAVPYVGKTALKRLREWAVAHAPAGAEAVADAIFSPMPYYASHVVETAARIDAAEHTVDVAMYSFSDEGMYDALEAAVDRGVRIRVLFQTANKDDKKQGQDRLDTRSARLEAMGIDVRFVNKIMHHKFALVDGPRDVLERAQSATLISGSANWSNGGATRYDENTLFLQGVPELALRFQREFDLLWAHARDFAATEVFAFEANTLTIDDAMIAAADQDDVDAVFTSANFTVKNTTFKVVSGQNTVANALVDAIERAETSILVASGHLRSRPVSEALMAKRQAAPHVEIRVLLDGQEYISAWYHDKQEKALDDCLEAADGNVSKVRKCTDKGYYYGYPISLAGIDVRYKYYAYRWHYSYAKQMHNKYLVIDGTELWTGSYNLSDNAEHNTFENMIVLRGERFAEVVSTYVDTFEVMWNQRRDDTTLESLHHKVGNASVIPLVFDAMALEHAEISALKTAIRVNCPDVNSADFRKEPSKHTVCFRSDDD